MARRTLPGFGLSLGITLTYLGLLVVIPLSTVVLKSSSLTASQFWNAVTSSRAVSSYALSLGASIGAALLNVVFGLVVAWVLVRYRFPGRRLVDSLVDLPFALPTAVAGIALAAVWAPSNGIFGEHLAKLGIATAFSRIGVVIALVFIGLPFVVRTVQPVLEGLDPRVEEAAATLGATRWQTFYRVVLPALRPALLTGFALAFARGLGEYGSIVFMSSNLPGSTEITPVVIMGQLDMHKYAEASAIALVLLVFSFAILIFINTLTWRASRRVIPVIRKRPPPDELVAPPAAKVV